MKKLLLTTTLIASFNVNAIIIDNNTYTTDTSSGLDWLDVTTSIRQSYNYVNSQFGSGGEYEGWRYASGTELNGLISNYTGNTITSFGTVNQEVNKIDGLVELLGSTLDSYWIHNYGQTWDADHRYNEGSGQDYTYGFISDDPGNGRVWTSMLWDRDHYNNYTDFSKIYDYKYWGRNSSFYHVGSYLVRDTANNSNQVPEPASLSLFALGLLALKRKLFS